MDIVKRLETRLTAIDAQAQNAIAGEGHCPSCDAPMRWRREGARWEGLCNRGHSFGGNIAPSKLLS